MSTKKPINKYVLIGNVCVVYTSKREKFLVDADKYELIKNISWHFDNKGYVTGNITINKKQHKVRLHRFITNCPENMVVDHINGDKSNNRMCNLRICSVKENIYNSGIQKRNTLNAKGVSMTHSGTYQAQIQVDGKLKYLGSYKTIKEASDAYDLAAKKYFGKFAKLNNYTNIS